MKFYATSPHGDIVTFLRGSGTPLYSRGRRMCPLASGSGGGAPEVHIPIISVDGNRVTVRVSTKAHPMLAVHYIQWIVLECANGEQRRLLSPGQAPEAVFTLADGDRVVAAYAYCNLHGLWASEQ